MSFERHVSHFMLALHLLLLVLAVADGAWATSSCSQGGETGIWTAPPLVSRRAARAHGGVPCLVCEGRWPLR